jgi:ABC-type sugar transport system ATPase subunit
MEHEETRGVRFTHISKIYTPGNAPAVNDFSLNVKEGEFLVLVGPSGCGKSTTMRMVAGLEMPTSGKIEINGVDVTYLPPKKRDIAMVFQNYALYPHMTVRENMAFALKLPRLKKEEIERRVNEAAETLGLTEYLDRLPKALSGGQRQRVAVGRAIVREPAVFLFDEPLSNLDAKMRVDMRAEIVRLHHRLKATMIYVTHDQTEAMTMGDRIVVMNGGKIQQVAPPLEIYSRPANTFVASFIGTPPMNLLPPGTLDEKRITGLRPEHWKVYPSSDTFSSQTPFFKAKVDIVEPLGAETIVHTIVKDSIRITVRVSGDAVHRHGEELILVPSIENAIFFDE